MKNEKKISDMSEKERKKQREQKRIYMANYRKKRRGEKKEKNFHGVGKFCSSYRKIRAKNGKRDTTVSRKRSGKFHFCITISK